MRNAMEWKMKREDGTCYEVRVSHFSKKFKFQFRDKGSEEWDYKRKPTKEDYEAFIDNVTRRYQRRMATHDELERAKRMQEIFLTDQF